jgi:S1-C subfamily serine protease
VLRQRGFGPLAADLERQLERASESRTKAGGTASQPTKAEPKRAQGTGFIVRPDGLLLTAYHVVRDAKQLSVRCPGREAVSAKIIEAAANVDLAVLQLPFSGMQYLALVEGRSIHQGDSVFTLGFPVPQLLGDGSVSSLSGPGGEATFLQVTVPVQPGNSGGPLLNGAGQVVGVVTSSAAVAPFLAATGTLPQSINWAIKADYAKPLFNAPSVSLPLAKNRSEAIHRARTTTCIIHSVR